MHERPAIPLLTMKSGARRYPARLVWAGGGLAVLLAIAPGPSLALAQESTGPPSTAPVSPGSTIRATAHPKSKAAPPHKLAREAGHAAKHKHGAATGDSKKGSDDSAPGGLPFSAGHGPINIQSDTLSLDYKSKAVVFSGHVHALQSGTQLSADTVHVNYEQNFKDVKDMTADGNVRMSQGGRWATSDHAVLNQQNHTVVMTGSPVVHDGHDQIAGRQITVYLDSGKSVVESAHAVIFPRRSENADNGSPDAEAAPSLDGKTPGAAASGSP